MADRDTTELSIHYDDGEGGDKPVIVKINEVLNRELSDPKALAALLATTFKGLDATKAKQAMMEGMIRGYTFQDFLRKSIYAVPFGSGYSLVTSIDDARKRGMKNGVIGKSAPVYTYKKDKPETGENIETCEITIKRIVNNHVGEFTALVYFDEYTKGRDLWKTKPRTMIAKVAEMHALRMACPEDLSQMYVEEEFEKEEEITSRRASRLSEAKSESRSLKMGSLNENSNKETTEARDREEDQDEATTTESHQDPA